MLNNHPVTGDFLGSVVEGHQRSSYLRRVQPGDDTPLPDARHYDRKPSGSTKSKKDDKKTRDNPESRFSYNLNKS